MLGLGSQSLGWKLENTPKCLNNYFHIVQFKGSMCLHSVTMMLEEKQGTLIYLFIIKINKVQ